jgi:phosphoribosylformylglycinamidine synthase
MKTGEIKVCILRIEGTNCEMETYQAFDRLGAAPELVHLKQLTGDVEAHERRDLSEYFCLIIPGGFSSGDYVRAGAILAARMKSSLRKELVRFVESGRPVGGICNGFQVLVELGLLPALGSTPMSDVPEAVLAVNDSARFECRPTLLRHEGKCVFTGKIPLRKIVCMPSAHGEGKLVFPDGEKKYLQRLIDNGQIVFRYVDDEGRYAGYPWNPNGSTYNIAGLCNPSGTVFGMMPHPERVFYPWMHQDWTRVSRKEGDGKAFFESVVSYIRRKF